MAVAELDGETFVGFDPALTIRRAIDRFLRKHEVATATAWSSTTSKTSSGPSRRRRGGDPAEPSLAREVKRTGSLRAIRFLDAELTRPLAIIHRRGGELGLTAPRGSSAS